MSVDKDFFARFLRESACHFSYSREKLKSLSEKEQENRAIVVIKDITGYSDKLGVSQWVRHGYLEPPFTKKSLTLSNLKKIIEAFAGSVPMLLSVEDVKYVFQHGREGYGDWLYDPKFKDWILGLGLPNGYISDYWKRSEKGLDSLWPFPQDDKFLRKDLRKESPEKLDKLCSLLLKEVQPLDRDNAAHVFWFFEFNLHAIQMTINLVAEDLISWRTIHDVLVEIRQVVNLSNSKKGHSLLVHFILRQIDSVHKDFFIAIGALPFLNHYSLVCFQGLWGMERDDFALETLYVLERWQLVNSLGKKRWEIDEGTWQIAQREFLGLSKRKKRFFERWDRRSLEISDIGKEFSKQLQIYFVDLGTLVDFFKLRNQRKNKGFYNQERDNFIARFLKQGFRLVSLKNYDSDHDFIKENSRSLDSEQFLFSRFLLFYWNRTFLGVVLVVSLRFLCAVLFPDFAIWANLFLLWVFVWSMMRILRAEKAWQGFLDDVLPLIPNQKIDSRL